MPRYIGNTEITASYLGDTLLTKRYLGDTDLGDVPAGNEGLRFNGIDSYARATTNLTLTGDFDYEVRIKYLGPTANNTQQHGVNGGDRCFFGIRDTNEFLFGHGSIWTDLGEYANFDQWYVFKISKVGSDYLCYIDDVLKHTAVGEATRTDFPVYIGCGSDATDETIPGLFNNAQIDYVDFVDLAGSNSTKWILDSCSIVSEESDPAGNPAVYHNVVAGDWVTCTMTVSVQDWTGNIIPEVNGMLHSDNPGGG